MESYCSMEFRKGKMNAYLIEGLFCNYMKFLVALYIFLTINAIIRWCR